MRKEFELTEQDLKDFAEATRPLPMLCLSGGVPMWRSRQERANDEWKRLGKKYGFIWDSVSPVDGKGEKFFSAEEKIEGEKDE